MWSSDILCGALTVLVIAAGIQDWRSGEVSNWLTIPPFAAGTIACAWRSFIDPPAGIMLSTFVLFLTALFLKKDWMGAADWKILVGLFGLWPLAGFASLIVAGIWGAIEMVRVRDPRVRFPGVSAFAIATALTFMVTLCKVTPC